MPAQSVKNSFFDRLTEVNKAVKTSNSKPSAYRGTVGFELCSKSKCLAKQELFFFVMGTILYKHKPQKKKQRHSIKISF